MAKEILKRGKLSAEEIDYIKENHKKVESIEIAKELKRSQTQVDKYIVENLKDHTEENKAALKKANPQVQLDRVGVATVMTPSAASQDGHRKKRPDPEWVFRQPQ